MAPRHPVHLLLGPETGQKDEFIAEIRALLSATHGGAPEEYKYFAFDTRAGDLVSLLRNSSLFSPHKLVVLANAEDVKKKDDMAILLEYCAKPSPDATLVLTSDSVGLEAKLERAVPSGAKKIFWELFDNQKSSWITNFFRKEGLSIHGDAVELLLEMVENDTRDLKKECDKLTSFFPRGAAVTAAEIEKYLFHTKEENVFTLFEQVVALNLSLSLEILGRILLSKDTNPVQILGGLLWQWRRLLSLRLLTESRTGREAAFTKLGMKSKRMQKIYGQGERNFTSGELERIVSLTAVYDAHIRSTKSDLHTHLLSMYLYYVVRRKGAPAELPVFA